MHLKSLLKTSAIAGLALLAGNVVFGQTITPTAIDVKGGNILMEGGQFANWGPASYIADSDNTGDPAFRFKSGWINANAPTRSFMTIMPEFGAGGVQTAGAFVGIGLTDFATDGVNRYTGRLQFNNETRNKIIVLWDGSLGSTNDPNSLNFHGFGINSSTTRYQVPLGGMHAFFQDATEVFKISGGSITTTNLIANKRFVLFEGNASSSHNFHGFGIAGNTLRYQADQPISSHIFYAPSLASTDANAGTATNVSNELLRVHGSGRVGINTGSLGGGNISPIARLQINAGTVLPVNINGSVAYSSVTASTPGLNMGANGTTYNWIQSSNAPLLLNPASGSPYVAVGFDPTATGAKIPTGYAFAVKGKVVCEELKIKMSSSWPDYVFESDFKLKPLNEVEAFVKTNKHLPEVPSEKEIQENGINTGEMDAMLLKKIEELTLYMIEQNKEIQALKVKNEELSKIIGNK